MLSVFSPQCPHGAEVLSTLTPAGVPHTFSGLLLRRACSWFSQAVPAKVIRLLSES